MGNSAERRVARQRRRSRVRRRVVGTDQRPRLCVFRSNKHLYLQIISDESGRTLATASTMESGGDANKLGAVVATAGELGREIAGRCKELSIDAVVFDRNGYRFHGCVRAVAEGAREAGLQL